MTSTQEQTTEFDGAETGQLSSTQQHLWFAEQIDPGRSLYTEALALRARGPLDEHVLHRALQEIVRRHDALRTVFPVVGTEPVQKVLPADTALHLQHASVGQLPSEQRMAAAGELVQEFVERRQDLTDQILTHALLVTLAADDHVLAVTLHHLVSDGLSGSIIFDELGQLYTAYTAGLGSPLPEPELQYLDYTDWEAELAGSGGLDRDVAYWRDQLVGVESVLELPARHPRPAVKGVCGTRTCYPLADGTTHTRAAEFCRQHRVSVYALTLSVFAATVSRRTAQHDLVFGTLAANRPRSELERVVGQFSNTLPMRLDVSGDPSLTELVGRVTAVSEQALDHGLLALGKIVEMVGPRRDPSRNALVQHLFLSSGQPVSNRTWDELAVEAFDVPRARGRLDTIVEIAEVGGELVSWVEYDTDLFDADEIEGLMRDFSDGLREWLDAPMLTVSQLHVPDLVDLGPRPTATRATPTPAVSEVASPSGAGTVDAPALTELMRRMWCEVLEVDHVDLEDDFFELGGHSMLSTRLIEKVRDTLDVAVPLRMLFTYSRLGEFSDEVRRSFPEIDDLLDVMAKLDGEETSELLGLLDDDTATTSTPSERARRLPLTAAQLQIWMLEYLRNAGITYTIPMEFHIDGPLDVDALRRSINAVVARHDVLRITVELTDEGEPEQVTHDEVRLDVPLTDLEGRDDAQAAEQEIRHRIGYHEFALAEGPMLAAHVVRRGPEQHTLYIVFHHLVMDERSMTLFMDDLSTHYACDRSDSAPPEPLRTQFGDYVVWEQAQLQDRTVGRLQDFWRSRLQGVPELELPTDHARPPTPGFRGEFLRHAESRVLFDDVAAMARAERVTPYAAFTAATALLLARTSGQERFLIGMPSDSRAMPGAQELIGCFINVLPIRVDCSGAPTFAELARRIADEVVAAYDHRALPLSQIVDALGVARTTEKLPLFQVTTELQVESWMPLQLAGCAIDFGFIGHGTARYDMAFHAMAKPDSFDVCVEVSSDVFTFDTGHRRLDQLSTLLREVAADPHRPVTQYR